MTKFMAISAGVAFGLLFSYPVHAALIMFAVAAYTLRYV